MVKWILILLLVIAGFATYAHHLPTPIEKAYNNQGLAFLRFHNNSHRVVYCWVSGNNYLQDMYLQPGQISRWFPEPYGYYTYHCE